MILMFRVQRQENAVGFIVNYAYKWQEIFLLYVIQENVLVGMRTV